MRGTRIGEFTPAGFLIGFALCLAFFVGIYRKLSFGITASTPPAQVITVHDIDDLSSRLKKQEQLTDNLEKRLRVAESKQKKGKQNHRTAKP
jgi:hypothetical protein